MITIFKNGKIILKDGILNDHFIAIKGGKILDIYADSSKYDGEFIDAKNNFISPGFVDMHVHGGGEGDFLDCDKESIFSILKMHTSHGTTTIFPTTLSGEFDELSKAIKLLNQIKNEDHGFAEIAGIHLEGPFLSQGQKGAQDERYIQNPVKGNFEKFLELEGVTRVTYAPEIEGGLDFARELKYRDIYGSLGHSDADYNIATEAMHLGSNHITHLYSGMQVVHRVNAYRQLGLVETAFLNDEFTVEIIADGKHLPQNLLKLIYKIKGGNSIALVTDAMRAAGRESGESVLGSMEKGQRVVLQDGVAFMPDGNCFAGSIATMDRCVRTMYKLAGVPIWEAVKMASLTPARINGIDKGKGSIEIGKDADILIFDDDIKLIRVMVKGV